MMMFVTRVKRVCVTTLSYEFTRCTGCCKAKEKVRLNLDIILDNKAHNCHGMIHNNIFKNTKLVDVPDLLAHQQELS
jgi:hypothetical protein